MEIEFLAVQPIINLPQSIHKPIVVLKECTNLYSAQSIASKIAEICSYNDDEGKDCSNFAYRGFKGKHVFTQRVRSSSCILILCTKSLYFGSEVSSLFGEMASLVKSGELSYENLGKILLKNRQNFASKTEKIEPNLFAKKAKEKPNLNPKKLSAKSNQNLLKYFKHSKEENSLQNLIQLPSNEKQVSPFLSQSNDFSNNLHLLGNVAINEDIKLFVSGQNLEKRFDVEGKMSISKGKLPFLVSYDDMDEVISHCQVNSKYLKGITSSNESDSFSRKTFCYNNAVLPEKYTHALSYSFRSCYTPEPLVVRASLSDEGNARKFEIRLTSKENLQTPFTNILVMALVPSDYIDPQITPITHPSSTFEATSQVIQWKKETMLSNESLSFSILFQGDKDVSSDDIQVQVTGLLKGCLYSNIEWFVEDLEKTCRDKIKVFKWTRLQIRLNSK